MCTLRISRRDSSSGSGIKASGTAQRGVDGVGAVGGAEDKHIFELLDAVHFYEDLSDEPVGEAVACVSAAGRCDGIYLIKEKDARRSLTGLGENVTDLFFRFAHEF